MPDTYNTHTVGQTVVKAPASSSAAAPGPKPPTGGQLWPRGNR